MGVDAGQSPIIDGRSELCLGFPFARKLIPFVNVTFDSISARLSIRRSGGIRICAYL